MPEVTCALIAEAYESWKMEQLKIDRRPQRKQSPVEFPNWSNLRLCEQS